MIFLDMMFLPLLLTGGGGEKALGVGGQSKVSTVEGLYCKYYMYRMYYVLGTV